MEVIGYTHSGGYCLCVKHGTDSEGNELQDTGNESGLVQPIFDGSEWDYIPTCDVCNEPIDGVTLTTEEE